MAIRFSGKIRRLSNLSDKELESYVKERRPSKKAIDEMIKRIRRK